mmetsp:Transcript_25066/g.50393  ORF Transcript_25066/g.50393 Transcript_25066/m.50393 type:complete len:417 (-) Transcript_25066:35-1285(-)
MLLFSAPLSSLPPRGPQFGNCKPTKWVWHPLPSATCLDGSSAGFYHTPAFNPAFKRSWLIYFEGGGWCVSPEDCALRATGTRGSSVRWPGNGTNFGLLLNKCCFATPFCRFHRVMLKSCDGHSFSGAATIPPVQQAIVGALGASGAPMHSAGRAIVRETLHVLLGQLGLRDAMDVLVAGCSAGGLAALLHAEAIREVMRDAGAYPRRFKVAALAGLFFPASGGLAAKANLSTPFVNQVAQAVALGAMQFSPRCLTRWRAEESWRCFFSTEPLDALPPDLPVFAVQSRLDLWQTSCVMSLGPARFSELGCAALPGWGACLGGFKPLFHSKRSGGITLKTSSCSAAQWQSLRAYEAANSHALASSAALQRAGSGAWVHSCHDHCPGNDVLLYSGARREGSNESFNMRQVEYAHVEDSA